MFSTLHKDNDEVPVRGANIHLENMHNYLSVFDKIIK